jgi:hypothetical protein
VIPAIKLEENINLSCSPVSLVDWVILLLLAYDELHLQQRQQPSQSAVNGTS